MQPEVRHGRLFFLLIDIFAVSIPDRVDTKNSVEWMNEPYFQSLGSKNGGGGGTR